MATAAPQRSNKTLLVVIALVLGVGCLPCTGILAAIAIPSFINYVRKSKTAEAEANLRLLFAGASTYYAAEHVTADGSLVSGCSVGPAVTANVPGPEKRVLGPLDPAFEALGFAPFDPVYFQYEIAAPPSSCGHGPNEALYTFRAIGDLDGDGVTSLFEMTSSTDALGQPAPAGGIYMESELE